MLRLIKRSSKYVLEYKKYCEEFYANKVTYFRPMNPNLIDDGWFERTKPLYDKKEQGLLDGYPKGFHYWAIDDGKFIGELQLRPEFSDKILNEVGNIGYAVKISEWGKGYGTEMLRQGLEIAKGHGMDRALILINEDNVASIRLCEKLGGVFEDTIDAYNDVEGHHKLRKYWITL